MKRARSKLRWAAGVTALALAIAVTASFGPLARSLARGRALRFGLRFEADSVRPGWMSVVFASVRLASLEPGASFHAELSEVRVGLGLTLQPEALEVVGGSVRARGSLDEIRSRFQPGGARAGEVRQTALTMRAKELTVGWESDADPTKHADLDGVSLTRDADGVRASVRKVSGNFAFGGAEVHDLDIELGHGGAFVAAHAHDALVVWGRAAFAEGRSDVSQEADADATQRTGDRAIALTDRIRARLAQFSGLFPQDARADIAQLTCRFGDDEAHALSLGPGAAELSRNETHFVATYATGAQADQAGLTIRALLPSAPDGDASVSLEGGPIPLELLGVHDGALGLVDTGHATLTGRAHVTLAGDRTGLTFDLAGQLRNLSLLQPRLAAAPLRGVDMQAALRGVMEPGGNLRFDELSMTFGVLHVEASGTLSQQPDRSSSAFRFELPSTSCEALLESMPTALLPALQGTRWRGSLGARGRVALDSLEPERLELEYDVQDDCHPTEVPTELARTRFKNPFEYKIYLPDGTTALQLSGPGSPNWTPLSDISAYLQVALLTTEDAAFPHHHGFNRAAIKSSIIANLKAHRFVRGASTLTMQLAKNLFLSRDKTLSRKLEEVVLTDYLEQAFSKEEILELYLNVVEFGPSVYGITAASQYYFGRNPDELDLAESFYLSSILPSPRRFAAMRDGDEAPDGWMRNLRSLMRIAHKRGLLTRSELEDGLAQRVVFWHGGPRPGLRPPVHRGSPLDGPVNEGDMDAPPDDPSMPAVP